MPGAAPFLGCIGTSCSWICAFSRNSAGPKVRLTVAPPGFRWSLVFFKSGTSLNVESYIQKEGSFKTEAASILPWSRFLPLPSFSFFLIWMSNFYRDKAPHLPVLNGSVCAMNTPLLTPDLYPVHFQIFLSVRKLTSWPRGPPPKPRPWPSLAGAHLEQVLIP